MYQLTIDLGTHGGFNDRIPYIAMHSGLLAQFHPIRRIDVALDYAVACCRRLGS